MYDLDERLYNAANQLDHHADPIQPRSLDELDRRVQRRDFLGDVGKAAAVVVLVVGPLVAWQTLRDRDDVTSVATAEPNAAVTSPNVPTPEGSISSTPTALDPTQTSIVESLPTNPTPGIPPTADGLTHEVVEPLIIEVLNAHGVATDAGSYEGKDTNPFVAYYNVGSIEVEVSNGWYDGTNEPGPPSTDPPDGEVVGIGGAAVETPDGWLYNNASDSETSQAAMIGAAATARMTADAGDASAATVEAIVKEISIRLNEETGLTFDPATVLAEHQLPWADEDPVPISEFTVEQRDQITALVSEVLGAQGFAMQGNTFEAPYTKLNFPGTSADQTVSVVFEPDLLFPGSDPSSTPPSSLPENNATATTSVPENTEPPGDETFQSISDGYIEGDRELGERMAVVSGESFSVAVIATASRPADLISDDDLLAIARELAVRAEPLVQ